MMTARLEENAFATKRSKFTTKRGVGAIEARLFQPADMKLQPGRTGIVTRECSKISPEGRPRITPIDANGKAEN